MGPRRRARASSAAEKRRAATLTLSACRCRPPIIKIIYLTVRYLIRIWVWRRVLLAWGRSCSISRKLRSFCEISSFRNHPTRPRSHDVRACPTRVPCRARAARPASPRSAECLRRDRVRLARVFLLLPCVAAFVPLAPLGRASGIQQHMRRAEGASMGASASRRAVLTGVTSLFASQAAFGARPPQHTIREMRRH